MKSPLLYIREATPSDAETLLELKTNYLRNTQTIPLYVEECTNDRQAETELILKYQKQKNSALFLAFQGDILVGNIDVTGNQRQKLKHTSVIGMGVHTDWQNNGIGTALLEYAVAWAKQNNIVRILWLEVYGSNLPGIALYSKIGFIKSGTIPEFFKEANGYIEKHTMYLKV